VTPRAVGRLRRAEIARVGRREWQALAVTGLLDDLKWRGLIHQMTDPDALSKLLDQDSLTAYIGFDPTADSLHVGHFQQIGLLRRIQQAGHRPIALVGGGTGMIGDPSGRSDERTLLGPEELEANRAGIRAQLERFVDFGDGRGLLVDNMEWLGSAGLLEFLRDVGKLYSVNEMIRKDSIRSRLEGREQGISFTEFSYLLLQAWDYLQLFDRYGCRLQMGGSDQWGNITEGVDLIRRRREADAFGLTSPLVTKADGSKFGKTASGTVWLDPRRTSPYQFFQYWLRSSDAEVGTFLRRLTFLDRAAIEELDESTGSHPEQREAQRVLARELTAMVHGRDEAERAERAAAVLFTEAIVTLDEAALASGLADAPSSPVGPAELDAGLSLVDALVRSGLASSKSDARRQLAAGSVQVNNRREPAERPLTRADALHGRFIVLRRGRTQHVLVVSG
jgi:tyrosyl-tRNA synthetase